MTDGQIHYAVGRLEKAVDRFTQPKVAIMQNHLRHAPSLYDQLRGDLPGTQGDTHTPAKSIPPLWIDAVDLLGTIDRTVQSWNPKPSTTPQRLNGLVAQKWRPQDTNKVDAMATKVDSWTVQAIALLEPTATKTISAPCPQCNQSTVYRRDSAGDMVRRPALQLVAHLGCTCQACKSHWPPSQYMWLTTLLGLDSPEGVCDTPDVAP